EDYGTVVVDNQVWRPFWWYNAWSEWPKDTSDVLAGSYGSCMSDGNYCFGRLPVQLKESSTKLLANDSDGNMFRLITIIGSGLFSVNPQSGRLKSSNDDAETIDVGENYEHVQAPTLAPRATGRRVATPLKESQPVVRNNIVGEFKVSSHPDDPAAAAADDENIIAISNVLYIAGGDDGTRETSARSRNSEETRLERRGSGRRGPGAGRISKQVGAHEWTTRRPVEFRSNSRVVANEEPTEEEPMRPATEAPPRDATKLTDFTSVETSATTAMMYDSTSMPTEETTPTEATSAAEATTTTTTTSAPAPVVKPDQGPEHVRPHESRSSIPLGRPKVANPHPLGRPPGRQLPPNVFLVSKNEPQVTTEASTTVRATRAAQPPLRASVEEEEEVEKEAVSQAEAKPAQKPVTKPPKPEEAKAEEEKEEETEEEKFNKLESKRLRWEARQARQRERQRKRAEKASAARERQFPARFRAQGDSRGRGYFPGGARPLSAQYGRSNNGYRAPVGQGYGQGYGRQRGGNARRGGARVGGRSPPGGASPDLYLGAVSSSEFQGTYPQRGTVLDRSEDDGGDRYKAANQYLGEYGTDRGGGGGYGDERYPGYANTDRRSSGYREYTNGYYPSPRLLASPPLDNYRSGFRASGRPQPARGTGTGYEQLGRVGTGYGYPAGRVYGLQKVSGRRRLVPTVAARGNEYPDPTSNFNNGFAVYRQQQLQPQPQYPQQPQQPQYQYLQQPYPQQQQVGGRPARRPEEARVRGGDNANDYSDYGGGYPDYGDYDDYTSSRVGPGEPFPDQPQYGLVKVSGTAGRGSEKEEEEPPRGRLRGGPLPPSPGPRRAPGPPPAQPQYGLIKVSGTAGQGGEAEEEEEGGEEEGGYLGPPGRGNPGFEGRGGYYGPPPRRGQPSFGWEAPQGAGNYNQGRARQPFYRRPSYYA
ncbi:PREDICTED: uncharacterized protein LOC106817159, partial [Priapulus caudatus]|uniref:Uncharacterized protein LOC106817159 n=1 Tax=Priapulus caudatus TaxID=37621 RepID=A0ABM1EYM8_PRICU